MLLFFISCLFVFAASYLLAAVFEKNSFIKFFIYLLLFAFANVVLTFEVLSLLTAISRSGVLLMNAGLLLVSLLVWLKRGKPVFKCSVKPFFKRLLAAMISDKYLMVLTVSTVFMVLVSLWLISFIPVVNPDAEAYHVLRSVFWVLDKKITHPPVSDVRNLVMPINSELLYAWILVFIKKQAWFGIFSFCGFLLSIVSLWGILSRIGIGFRRKLWTICILSSFASVIVQVSSTETDIIISGLVLASMYLYWSGIRKHEAVPVVLSALSYALAVGTKTPAIILIPAVGLWMCGFSVYDLRKNFWRPLCLFAGAFIGFFAIFASYNYILNYIDFGNIAGSKYFLSVHQNFGGFKSACANFIKYIFMFFDFTGFALNNTLGHHVINLRDSILLSLGLERVADGFFSTNSARTNSSLLEPLMGLGVLGFLVYLPCLLIALVKPIFTRKRQDIMIMSFAVILLISLFVLGYKVAYMTYSIRFFTCFCVICSPVLVYSYFRKNNILKFGIVFFALFGLLGVSTHLWSRPALLIMRYFKNGTTIHQIREIGICSMFNTHVAKKKNALMNSPIISEMCFVREQIKNYDKRNHILFLSNMSDSLLPVALMNFEGYNIDFNIIEDVDNIDLSKYNLILILNDYQVATNIKNYENRNKGKRYQRRGVVCYYFNHKGDEVDGSKDNIPFLSNCTAQSYFFSMNGFEFDRLFTINRMENKKLKPADYKFYENTNNPVIVKPLD